MRPKDEHYNETELGFREYIRRLEVDLAAKNRQIRELLEAPGTLAWTAGGSDAEPERPRPVQDGLAALHGAALPWPWLWRHAQRVAAARPVRIAAFAVAGTAALTAAAALSAPGPAVPAPLRLAAPKPAPALHLAVRNLQPTRRPGTAIAKMPGIPAHAGAVHNVTEPVTIPVSLTDRTHHASRDPGAASNARQRAGHSPANAHSHHKVHGHGHQKQPDRTTPGWGS